MAATIRTYRSALSTMHGESQWGHLPAPTDAEPVARIIEGIRRAHNDRDKAKRAERATSFEVMPSMVAPMETRLSGITPADGMHWAALCLASYGGLRIGEFLPRGDAARLTVTAVEFYNREGKRIIGEAAVQAPSGPVPDYFTINLGRTKTDQLANESIHPIAAPVAVRAMWRWLSWKNWQRHTGIKGGSESLFQCAPYPHMEREELFSFTQDCLQRSGLGTRNITGKSFRRGAASEAVARNIPGHLAQTIGRWKSPAMLEVYASDRAKLERAIAASRALDPSPQ